MIMTMDQYLANPQGKGSVLSHAKQWRAEYDPRYERLIALVESFETYVYKNGSNQYYIHVKMPSETHAEVMYDVVLKVDKKGLVSDKSITDWQLRAISNSPSFVFTYENVFRRNKLLVEELKSLLPDEAYDNPPKIRNPFNAVGYEKTVYFAIKNLIANGYTSITKLEQVASKIDLRQLRKEFSDFDKVMKTIDTEQKKKVEENKLKRAKEKKIQKKQRNVRLSHNNLPPGQQEVNTQATIVDREANRLKPKQTVATKSNRIKPVKKL
jgi:hypothetical protein